MRYFLYASHIVPKKPYDQNRVKVSFLPVSQGFAGMNEIHKHNSFWGGPVSLGGGEKSELGSSPPHAHVWWPISEELRE